jgi:ankyrin repeat protein
MSELTDAIKTGDAAKVQSLVDADPALVRAAENDVTPLLLALYHGKSDIAQLLAARGALSFHEAAAIGDVDRVRLLLDADPSLLDARSGDGFPALGLAIFFRQPQVARFLIERGADVNAAAGNAQRVAPLHAAAAVCDRETMQLLLERGADPNAKQQLDYTPLHGAASRGDIEAAKLLLDRGALRDARGSDDLTPADIARKYGKPEFAEWISGGAAPASNAGS